MWRRVLLGLMMLWLPMQSVVAVAMPMCQGRHGPAEAGPMHHRASTGHARTAHHAETTDGGATMHHAAHTSHAANTDHAAHAHSAAGSDLAAAAHVTGHAAAAHDCSGCGACHLACAPLLGVRGFDFAVTFTSVPIAIAQPLPRLRTLDQPHPPPLA